MTQFSEAGKALKILLTKIFFFARPIEKVTKGELIAVLVHDIVSFVVAAMFGTTC